MNITQQLFSRLPNQAQLSLANKLLDYNILYRLPLFRMFFHTLESFGADKEEMLLALEQARNFNGSFHQSWFNLGRDLHSQAREHEAEGDPCSAKDKYLRAAIYHLVADWPLERGPLKRRNYQIALDCFEDFKRFHIPRIEKVDLPFPRGKLKANLRLPKGARKPVPAVVIFQGNDSVKEFMVFVEDYALERGIATLSVDQPGFGESGMTGNLLDSERAARLCIGTALRYMTHHPRIDHDAVGAFGFSFGGFTSLYSAGLSDKVRAVATIGAPMHLMKQRTFQWSGCTSDREVETMLHAMDVQRVVGRIQCPAYILHGREDEVVDPREALSIGKAIQGPVRLEFVDDADHTCSVHLDELLPKVFDWMKATLTEGRRVL
jgi:dienelactone hydrolase